MQFKVLIVDDEPLIARSVGNIITKVNDAFVVEKICYNGQMALEYLEENSVDIIFTDVQMPIMNGLEFAGEVAKKNPNIPIVILSGYSEFEYAKKAITIGVQDYLLKPLNREQVTILLGELENKLKLKKYTKQINILNKVISVPNFEWDKDTVSNLFPSEEYAIFLTCSNFHFDVLDGGESIIRILIVV